MGYFLSLRVGLLIVVLHLFIVHFLFLVHHRVLLVIIFHELHVHLVVHLESLSLNLLLPGVVVDLYVVKDGIHQYSNVRVLIRE